MFRIHFLSAQQGDAIWIEYGKPGAIHRVIIDAGTPATGALVCERIERLAPGDRTFDLLVVSHVDTDHIGGVLKLLADPPAGVAFRDLWFNGWKHIRRERSGVLGPVDGEILSTFIEKRKWPWNALFGGQAIGVPERGSLPSKQLDGGMRLTVLSPGPTQLVTLRDVWKEVVRDAGLDPSNKNRWKRLLEAAARKGVKSSILGEPDVRKLASSTFDADDAPANGSSIAFLAEYEDKRALLVGDAHAPVLERSIARLCKARKVAALDVDVFKLPHHGSRANTNNALLAAVHTREYVFSTSGTIFGHPDDEAVARVIANRAKGTKTLHFNYPARTLAANYEKIKKRTPPKWDKQKLLRDFDYVVKYATNDDAGLVLDL